MPGTVTIVHEQRAPVRAIRLTVVADASDASVPDTELPAFSGKLIALETDPGGTAPTDNYDVTVENANGHDVLEGVGANRDTANSERVGVVFSGTSLHPPVAADDVLTFKIANNAVNSAQVEVVLYYEGTPVE